MYSKETVSKIIQLTIEGYFLSGDEVLSRLKEIPEEFHKEILASILALYTTISLRDIM